MVYIYSITILLKKASSHFLWLAIIFAVAITAPIQVYSQITEGLLLRYDLNGGFEDSSPNAFDGSGFNATFVDDGAGNPQGALSANGNNTYVEFPNNAALKPGFPISMAARVKFDYLGGTQIVAATDFGVSTHSGAWLQLSSLDQVAVAYGNGQGGFNGSTLHSKRSDFEVEVNTWYFIVVIIRGYQDIDIYIDCELQDGFYSGSAQTIGYTEATGSLCRKRGVPDAVNPPYYLGGDIDSFWYWDRALNPEEIVPLCDNLNCPGELVAEDNQACVNSTLSYNFELIGEPDNISQVIWTFGDGTTSNNFTPTKTYNSSGSYPFNLEVIIDNGCIYEITGNTEIVELPENPTVPDSISICEGESFFLDFADFSDWDLILDPEGNNVTSYIFEDPGIYEFSFVHNCGQAQVSIEVFQTITTGYLTYNGENPLCENSEVSIMINNWDNIQSISSLFIDFGNENGEFVSSTVMENLYTESGTYIVELSGTVSNCEVSESLTIAVESPIDLGFNSFYEICEGSTVFLDFSDLDFAIYDSNGELIDVFSSNIAGTYTFSAENTCGSVSEEIEIAVIPFQPNPYPLEVEICPVSDTVSIGLVSNSYVYSWDTGQSTPLIDVFLPGSFTVNVSDSTGFCNTEFTFNISEIPMIKEPIFNMPELDLCYEGNTLLTPNNLGFIYTFPDGSEGYSYNVEFPGVIEVSYSDGCYEYQESIDVAIETCLCPVIVPNIFTPNGDGKNDIFKPFYECETPIFNISIFNRWGQLVFESDDIDIGWNSQTLDSQKESSDGIYFYFIEYAQYVDDVPIYKSLSGNITLLR